MTNIDCNQELARKVDSQTELEATEFGGISYIEEVLKKLLEDVSTCFTFQPCGAMPFAWLWSNH